MGLGKPFNIHVKSFKMFFEMPSLVECFVIAISAQTITKVVIMTLGIFNHHVATSMTTQSSVDIIYPFYIRLNYEIIPLTGADV